MLQQQTGVDSLSAATQILIIRQDLGGCKQSATTKMQQPCRKSLISIEKEQLQRTRSPQHGILVFIKGWLLITFRTPPA